jgi:2-dehydro-3-deoxygalactonokinase
MAAARADWIAADWGRERLRAWAMAADGTPRGEARTGAGTAALGGHGFEAALLDVVSDWLGERTLVLACGDVGGPDGWADAPCPEVPCAPPSGDRAMRASATDARLDLRLLPGLRQARPADVMRGEETRIAGLLRQEPGFDGVLCLPGAQTRWVQISAGEVVSFRSFLTGELIALLSDGPTLSQAVAGTGWDEAAFESALGDAMARPALVTSDLAGLRATHEVQGQAPAVARARLAGLLTGLELAGARPYWLGQRLAVIGPPEEARRYAAALAAQGAAPETHHGDSLVIEGLAAARAALP